MKKYQHTRLSEKGSVGISHFVNCFPYFILRNILDCNSKIKTIFWALSIELIDEYVGQYDRKLE